MSGITTHVLDTGIGSPAAAVAIELYRLEDAGWTELAAAVTNTAGRTDAPLLSPPQSAAGLYELRFHLGRYFRSTGRESFYDVVPVRFRISDPAAHHHVPLLASPWGYTTYRGS
jgi:5-hydroxyisourate hydrolase